MYGCVRTCALFVALHHVACLVAAIWLHAIRVPPSKALALANMAGVEVGERGAGMKLKRLGLGVGGVGWKERQYI